MCVDLREWENRYHVLRERAGGGSVFGSAGVGAVGVLLFVVVVVLLLLYIHFLLIYFRFVKKSINESVKSLY